NYLLFTPLLPQVASSLVEPRHIVQPIRDIRGARRFRFRRDTVCDIDLAGRRVILAEGTIDYDRLVIAVGGVTPTYGIPGVEEHALNYKRLDDAVLLRDHLIDLAEHADHEPDRERRRRMLTVCVVGGGYTGIELVAELEDFFSSYVVPRYRGVDGAGDAVTIEGNPGASIPIIPAALAHGRLAGENIIADLAGRRLAAIDFAPRGMLVSLGERDAVVEIMGLKFSGYLAWLFWNALHLYKLVGFRKQIQVALDWSLAPFFPRDSSMMRQTQRCPICATPGASPSECEVA